MKGRGRSLTIPTTTAAVMLALVLGCSEVADEWGAPAPSQAHPTSSGISITEDELSFDPRTCTEGTATLWLSLGSAKVRVLGHESGGCVFEYTYEIEGDYTAYKCRVPIGSGLVTIEAVGDAEVRTSFPLESAEIVRKGNELMEDAAPTLTILSTDLSMDKDVDDWFDLFVFSQCKGIHPYGIVLEHYATDEVEAKTREFLDLLGRGDIRVARGIQEKLTGTTDQPQHGPHGDGADFILETMRDTPAKVRLICVGSLRNEAIAYQRDPELFLAKIERLYFAGGNLSGTRECNVGRDPLAADIIINAPIPKVWIPCTPDHKQKLSGDDERRIADASNPVAVFLTDMLAKWRQGRGPKFLDNTEQQPHQGKNLWSLPAFLHATGEGAEWMAFVSGKMGFDETRWTRFDERPNGPDLMLKTRDARAICDWLADTIQGSSRTG